MKKYHELSISEKVFVKGLIVDYGDKIKLEYLKSDFFDMDRLLK